MQNERMICKMKREYVWKDSQKCENMQTEQDELQKQDEHSAGRATR